MVQLAKRQAGGHTGMREMRGEASDAGSGRLATLDLGKALPKAAYKRQLKTLQLRLTQIQQVYLRIGKSAVIVFEGWDAAGKGGTMPGSVRRDSIAMLGRPNRV